MEILFKKNISYIILFYFFMKAFDGAIRYFLSLFQLTILAYLPIVLMATALIVNVLYVFYKMRVKVSGAIIISLIFLFVINAFFNISSLKQIIWGLYILIPFLFGFTFTDSIINEFQQNKKIIFILALIAGIGVVTNYFISFPWQGFTYEIQGQSIEGSRQWSTHGISRLAGLGRTSFSSAVTICSLSLIVFTFKKCKLSCLLLWIISFIAIILTTTKGIIAVYTILTIILISRNWINVFFLRRLPVFVLLVMILLPFGSAYYFRNTFSPQLGENHLDSFFIRIISTWPQGVHAISENGNFLLGRGIGGLGIPAGKMNDIISAGPGDNMAVYVFGIGGILGLFLLLKLALKASKAAVTYWRSEYLFIYLSVLMLFLYGITTNIIESAILSVFLGLVTGKKLK